MKRSQKHTALLSGLSLLFVAASTGCQMDVGGQTLPSPYYLSDDVQYFPAGPEFKLSREAAAMRSLQTGGYGPAVPPPMGIVPAPAPAPAPGLVPTENVPPPAAQP